MPRFHSIGCYPSVLACLFIACTVGSGRAEDADHSSLKESGSPTARAQSDDPAFSKEAMGADIGYLADDERQGRFPGTAGDEETLAYIEKRFQSLGLEAPFQGGSYRQPFVGAGLSTANVAAMLVGSDPALSSEILVIGAHHDHRGVKNGEIQNGANDNASGVAAVLAIAKAVREGPAPRRTIVFATFGYEENDDDGPCWGSEFFVKNLPLDTPTDSVVYMMNLDMLGSYPSTHRLDAYGTFDDTVGKSTVEAKMSAFPNLKVALGGVPEENDSDFQAFCTAGIPYVYFATDDDTCYHEACDDLDKVDFPSLLAITQLAHGVLLDLANSPADLKAGRGTQGACKG